MAFSSAAPTSSMVMEVTPRLRLLTVFSRRVTTGIRLGKKRGGVLVAEAEGDLAEVIRLAAVFV